MYKITLMSLLYTIKKEKQKKYQNLQIRGHFIGLESLDSEITKTISLT